MNIRNAATRAVVFGLLAGGVSQTLTSQQRGGPGADSLYREARLLLNQRSYERALDLFRTVQREHAASEFAAQSAYWEAYSLYRLGGARRLHEAQAILEAQLRESQGTATRHRDVAELRARINSLLAERGGVEGFRQLSQDALAEDGCDRETLGVRMEALRALSRLDPELARPSIVRILERHDECMVELRRQAVMMIPEVMDQATAETLVANVIRTDPSLAVQLTALLVLSHVPSEPAVALLSETARNHSDQRMRQQALMALTRTGSETAITVLRDIAASEAALENDRLVAIAGLSSSRSSADFLRNLYSSTQSLEVKVQILQLLGRSGLAESADWLMGIARDTTADPSLRRQALVWAAQSDVDLSQLIDMYRAEQNPGLMEDLVMVISRYQSRDPRAVDIIIDIARNSEYPGLRRRAIAMLVQSDSPRAAEVLVELLEQ